MVRNCRLWEMGNYLFLPALILVLEVMDHCMNLLLTVLKDISVRIRIITVQSTSVRLLVFSATASHINDGTIGFSTGGTGSAGATISQTDRMVILDNGNVGIGTTGPQSALDVAGTQIQLSDPSQALSNYSYLKTSAYTFNIQKLTLGTTYGYGTPVDALTIFDGNVGIGRRNPTTFLQLMPQITLSVIAIQ